VGKGGGESERGMRGGKQQRLEVGSTRSGEGGTKKRQEGGGDMVRGEGGLNRGEVGGGGGVVSNVVERARGITWNKREGEYKEGKGGERV